MAYATREDLEKMYGVQLLAIVADLTEDGITEDDAVSAALDEASSEIDAYLAVKFQVPVLGAPPILTQLCRDMAIYRLALSSSKRTNEMRVRYEDAIKMLEKMAAGKVGVPFLPADLDGDGDIDEDDVRPSPYVLRTARR
jgi:phage gp36-like protein